MIRFFQKIRLKLMDKGNVRRYLIYAIGEILLVVFGILIALQINNWNEYRRDRKGELKALNDLRAEFSSNEQEFEKHRAFKNHVLKEWKVYLAAASDRDKSDTDPVAYRPRLATKSYKVSNNNLNSLLSSGKIENIRNDSLYLLLTRWEDILKEYQESEENQNRWGQDHLLPYEATIIPMSRGIYQDVNIAFYPDKEIEGFLRDAHQDLTYQNLLIRNLFILREQANKAALVRAAYADILRLLDREIASF